MVDPVVSSMVGQMESLTQPEPTLGAAHPTDVERFDAAMDAPQEGQVSGVDGDMQASLRPVDRAQEAEGNLLRNIDGLSHDASRMHTEVMTSLGNAGEMGEMFRLQFQVANLTTTQTIVGQTGQKGSQGVQTLLKGQ